MSLYSILKTLASTNSLNEKRNILENNKSNNDLKEFFLYCLDHRYNYGVKNAPNLLLKHNDKNEQDWNKIKAVLDRLLVNKRNKNEVFEQIENNFTVEEYDIFCRVLKKDPKCGVSFALANDNWKNTLHQGVKVCKAMNYSKKNLQAIKYPAIVQTKADGARCLLFCSWNDSRNVFDVEAYTSSGKLFHHIQGLAKSIKHTSIDSFVLDGELMVLDESGCIMPRKTGNGILNKSIKNTITPEEATRIRMFIWDFIPIEDYNIGICQIPYTERLAIAQTLIDNDLIKLINTKQINSVDEAREEFNKEIAAGEEGIILKNADFAWEGKRVKNQVKFKLDLQCTLEVESWHYGTKGTKYESMLGSLTCVSSDKLVRVNIGSGMSDEFRQNFMTWENKTGFFIEVQFNSVISAEENGTYSLFLPRMVDLRLDKTEADDYKTICALVDNTKGIS